MGFLSTYKRVNLKGYPGEWVDIRPLSAESLRNMRVAVAELVPLPGEEKEEAQGFELSRMALEACIAGWSDEAEVSPENIAKMPYEVALEIQAALGLGEAPAPLPNGPDSGDTSAVFQEE